jgi:hypothetical protein
MGNGLHLLNRIQLYSQIEYTEFISVPAQILIIQILINFVNCAAGKLEMVVAKLLYTKVISGPIL